MRKTPLGIVARVAIVMAASLSVLHGADAPKQLIAHRGASGYAPEHTAAAYRLAIEQKADFVERIWPLRRKRPHLPARRHLERTTNVDEVFPDRFSRDQARRTGKQWLANDFTLAEIKHLDAGSWFDPKFAGERSQLGRK